MTGSSFKGHINFTSFSPVEVEIVDVVEVFSGKGTEKKKRKQMINQT